MSTRHQAREIAFQILYRQDQVREASESKKSGKAAKSDKSPITPNASAPDTNGTNNAGHHDEAEAVESITTPIASTEEILRELREHFEHFRVAPELREFAALLAAGTIRHARELDTLLKKHAANWRISRMSLVDRNLLRMAIYELKYVPETPPSVVIDEAIELAKQFGTSESPAFINGVLDAIKSEVQPAPAAE